MTHILGMTVEVKTGSVPGYNPLASGTISYVYLGLIGKGGSREFLISNNFFSSPGFTNPEYYLFGNIWSKGGTPWKIPSKGGPGEGNSPDFYRMELDQIDYVYIRKHAKHTDKKDDEWLVEKVNVKLYGGDPEVREFEFFDTVWLGYDFGTRAFLTERL